jgi:hypothetical protein
MQTCRTCKKELSLSFFKQKKDGKYTTGCELCRNKDKIKAQQRREKINNKVFQKDQVIVYRVLKFYLWINLRFLKKEFL